MNNQNNSGNLTEQQKVRKIFDLIGERGLFVSTNYDVFTSPPEEIALSGGAGYKVPLIADGSMAYSSPLLFASLTALLNHGTMIVTGAPGIGKTTGLEFAGHFFTGTPLEDILEAEIQGHPQLTEEKMIARYKLGKLVTSGEEEVIPRKFLQCPVKIMDEVTRNPPDVLSIIMRLVDTGMAVYGNELLTAVTGPLYGTANYADEGSFQLTPPFLDRFDIAVMVTSPPEWDLKKIRARGDEKLNGSLKKMLEIPENLSLNFEAVRKQIKDMPEKTEHDVPVVSAFADFLYGSLRFSEAASDNIARATKGNAWQQNQDNAPAGHFRDSPFNYTLNELSVRTAKAMSRYAKAFAWFNGKDKVELDDLKTILPYLLWHKIVPAQTALVNHPKYNNDRIDFVNGLVKKVEENYNEMLGSDAMKKYSVALRAIEDGKIGNKALSRDKTKNIAKNAILALGNIDRPYAIALANHVASSYNTKFNGIKPD